MPLMPFFVLICLPLEGHTSQLLVRVDPACYGPPARQGIANPRPGGAQLCGVISLESRAVAADGGATPHLCGLHIE